MVFIYVVENFGQIITSQLHNQTAYMLALQACPAAQLQPSSFEGWCPNQYSSHHLSPLAELQYASCVFMMFSLQVLPLHSPIHCLNHGEGREPTI